MTRVAGKGGVRNVLAAMAAIVVGLVVSLLLLEGLLRGLGGLLPAELQQMLRASARNMGVAHPYIGYLHTPNHSFVVSGRDFRALNHTDGHGFRNAWPWPGRAEIVAVGDSVTFGYGVGDSEAWPAVLARKMPPARVINLGLIGAGPQQYLRVYETFGIPLRPAVVLVGVFVGNDFWDADVFDRWERSHAGGNYIVWRDFGRGEPSDDRLASPGARLKRGVVSTGYLLAQHSRVVRLIRVLVNAVRQRRSMPPKEFVFGDGSRLRLVPDQLAVNTKGARPGRHEFRLVVQALQRIQQLTAENGSHLLVVLQPSKEEVYLPLLDHAPHDPARPLREALARLGIDSLDLGPIFRERAAAGVRLFFEVDGHPNVAGYALIADGVQRELERRHYVQPEDMRRPASASSTGRR